MSEPEDLDPYHTWRESFEESGRRVYFFETDDYLQFGEPPWYKVPFPESDATRVDPALYRAGDLVAWTSVSPSQIDNFNKCKRAWWFKSIARISEPQRVFQATGEATHLILEKCDSPEGTLPREGYEYVRSDVPTAGAKEWDVAQALASYMAKRLPRQPKPGEPGKILREHKIAMDTYPGGPTMIGYVDLAVSPGIGCEPLLMPKDDKTAIIIDYKTLSDFRYMKSPAELAENVQMTVYGKWALTPGDLVRWDETPPEQVYLTHLYGKTRTPITNNSVRHESALLSRAQIDVEWNKTLDIVREMEQVAKCETSDDVEPTGTFNDHCNAYGGCSYRQKCGLTTESPLKNLFQITKKPTSTSGEQATMSNDSAGSALLARIAAARASASAKAGNPAPSAPAPTTSTTTPTTPATPSAPTPSEFKSDAGPISTLISQIKAKYDGARPQIAGIIAVQFAKEQGYAKTDTQYPGEGALATTIARNVGDLVTLANGPAKTEPSKGVIPTDAPPREQPVVTRPGDGVAVADPEAEDDEEGEAGETPSAASEAIAAAIAASPTNGAAEPGNAQSDAPKKRGRPTNAELAAKREAEAQAMEAEINRRVHERLKSIPSGDNATTFELVKEIEDLKKANAELAQVNELTKDRLADAKKNADYYQGLANSAAQGLAALKPNGIATSPGASVAEGFTLFVDSFPTKGAPEGLVDYLEWYAPLAFAVAEGAKVDDWRLIQYTAKGLLAQAMRESIKAEGLPKAMHISSAAPGADVALEVLSPFAKRVIRQMR